MKSEAINPRMTAFKFMSYLERTGARITTETVLTDPRLSPSHSDFIGPQQYGVALTHDERYGWNPDDARKGMDYGGKDGTPRFKGYFG